MYSYFSRFAEFLNRPLSVYTRRNKSLTVSIIKIVRDIIFVFNGTHT